MRNSETHVSNNDIMSTKESAYLSENRVMKREGGEAMFSYVTWLVIGLASGTVLAASGMWLLYREAMKEKKEKRP